MSSTDTQQYLICPITLELFNDPVIAQDGNTYERKAITQWINQYGTSPITKKPLNINQLTPNHTVKDAVKVFKQQNPQANTNRENLDVLCLYCGSTQKLNNIRDHKTRCSAKPVTIEPLEIADNESMFTMSQQTSSKKKSFHKEKTLSFHNPFAYRADNSTNHDIPVHDAGNRINMKLVTDSRCSISKLKLKYLLPVLLFITLIIISITLGVYYSKPKREEFSTGPMIAPNLTSTLSSTWSSTTDSASASTSTLSSISITTSSPTPTSSSTSLWTSSSTLTSTAIPKFLCASAEWDPNGITIVSGLHDPYDIAIDSEDNLIIADTENRRLEKYFNNKTMTTLVTNTKIPGIFIDQFDNIYFIDAFGDEVDKLNSYDGSVITVAGGNGLGSALDQLRFSGDPKIYVDQNSTLYISDTGNNRVMKYYENATSGIVVAGGHGAGSDANQLNNPYGIYVDEINEIGAIYVCDEFNRRIQKWLPNAKEGITVASNNDQLHSLNAILLAPTSDKSIIMYISDFYHHQILKWIPYAETAESIVAGTGHGAGTDPNQIFGQRGIAFDRNWNLFVADTGNDRIQKFLFNTSSCTN